MKKKWLALLLGTAMAGTLLVGCGNGAEEAPAAQEENAEVQTPEEPAVEEETETEVVKEEETPAFEETTITISYNAAETTPHGQGVAKFKELVEEKTGGAVTVDAYYNGTLYGTQTEFEALQKGEVDLIMGSLNSAMEYIPKLKTTFCPFLWKNPEHYNAFWDSEDGQALLEEVADELDVYYLGFSSAGARNIELTEDKQITCREDMKSIKLRSAAAENMIAMVDALGANPVPIAFSDTYLGLETGLAQGLEGDVTGLYANGFNEVLKSITITEHAYSMDGFVASAANWEKWSPEVQAVVREAVKESSDYINQVTADSEASAAERLASDGIKIYELPADTLEAYREEVLESFINSDYAKDYDMDLFNKIREMGNEF